MNEPTTKLSTAEVILNKIKNGQLNMRSRNYFILRSFALGCVSFLVLVLTVVVSSFTLFSIHESGELFLLGFGVRGVTTFFILFPWSLLLLLVVGVVSVRWLLNEFPVVYRVPLLSLFFTTFGSVVLLSIPIVLTSFHSEIFERVQNVEIPIISELYREIYVDDERYGEFSGVVIARTNSSFTISHDDGDADEDDGTRLVVLQEGTTADNIVIGDYVYVAGELQGTTIVAYGIKKLSRVFNY